MKLQERDAPRICPLCRDALGPSERSQCPGCATEYHPECLTQLGGCSTLGCEQRETRRPAPPPQPRIRARLREWPDDGSWVEVERETIGGIALMLALSIGSLLGGLALFSMPEELLFPGILTLGVGAYLLFSSLRAIARRLVGRAILEPSAWASPQEVEPFQEVEVGLAFGLPESVRLKRVTVSLRREETRVAGNQLRVETHDQELGVLEGGPPGANSRREFRGSFEVPETALPSFSNRNGRARSWSVLLRVELERYPVAWSVTLPLDMFPTQRPDLDTRAVLAFEREVEAWLPEFVQEALRNPAPYDEEQRHAIARVAARRQIR